MRLQQGQIARELLDWQGKLTPLNQSSPPRVMTTALKNFIVGVADVVDPSPVRFPPAPNNSTIVRDAANHIRYGFKTAANEAQRATGSSNPVHRKGTGKAD
ncbi:MAG: hypothetical protein ACLFVC_07565 [Opitutales bacterium]